MYGWSQGKIEFVFQDKALLLQFIQMGIRTSLFHLEVGNLFIKGLVTVVGLLKVGVTLPQLFEAGTQIGKLLLGLCVRLSVISAPYQSQCEDAR